MAGQDSAVSAGTAPISMDSSGAADTLPMLPNTAVVTDAAPMLPSTEVSLDTAPIFMDTSGAADPASVFVDTTLAYDMVLIFVDTAVSADTASIFVDTSGAADTLPMLQNTAFVADSALMLPNTAVSVDMASIFVDTSGAADTLPILPNTAVVADAAPMLPNTAVSADTASVFVDTSGAADTLAMLPNTAVSADDDCMSFAPVSRKRVRNAQEWRQNKRKRLMNSGKRYVSAKGCIVPAKVFAGIRKRCCRSKCVSKLTEAEAQNIFDKFWQLGNHDVQSAYIAGCVKQQGVATHRVPVMAPGQKNRPKSFSRTYTLQVADRTVTVCKQVFLSVLGITSGRVHQIIKMQRYNGGVAPTDRRGKSLSLARKRVQRECLQSVEDHINSFPVNESHYTRSHSESRRYLSPDLNIAKMYSLYVEEMQTVNVNPVKEWCYRHVFNTKFNLTFHQPRKDTCKRCDLFKVQIDAETDKAKMLTLQGDHELHLRKAEIVRDCIIADQNASSASVKFEAFTFDLQKVMSFPHLSTNEVYYCRQLSAYNLGIHSLSRQTTVMNVWDESVASRGAVEIGSCLTKYCLSKANEGVRHVTAYSDACGGQNRNHKIALFWMHICNSSDIEVINHKFMVSGHSYLPNDSDFGVVERATNKSSELFVPEKWYSLIEKCKRKKPFSVCRIDRDMFLSISELQKYTTIRKTSIDGHNVEWLKMQWIQIRKEEPLKMFFKYSVQEDIEFQCVDFSKKGNSLADSEYTLQPLYREQRPLSHEKAADIKKLLKYLPTVHLKFYTDICDHVSTCLHQVAADEVDNVVAESVDMASTSERSSRRCPVRSSSKVLLTSKENIVAESVDMASTSDDFTPIQQRSSRRRPARSLNKLLLTGKENVVAESVDMASTSDDFTPIQQRSSRW
jgi:hypothetical protein